MLVSAARFLLGGLAPGAAAAGPMPAGGGAALRWAWVSGGGTTSGAAVSAPVPGMGGVAEFTEKFLDRYARLHQYASYWCCTTGNIHR